MENTTETTEKSREKKTIYRILVVLFAVGFLACAVWLTKYVVDLQRSKEQLNELMESYVTESTDAIVTVPESAEQTGSETTEPETEPTAEDVQAQREELLATYSVPDKTIDFATLQQEQNADIYAWITIPDTQIDYPVLQHPTETDYYLSYNLDGTKGYPGCIYSQIANSKDFTDSVTVLYGHNMKNGSMFANLHYYEDPEFFESHPYIYIYTPEETLVYQVFAAYQYHNGNILTYNNVTTPEGLETYIDSIYAQEGMNNQYDEDARPTVEDRILDLSTCISGKAEKRWIVSAKLAAEIPQSEEEP